MLPSDCTQYDPVYPSLENEPFETYVRGRDLVTGLPREVAITDSDIREAIAHSIDGLVESIREVLESTPPEIVADVMSRGIHLTGGGALMKGFDVLLSELLKVPVHLTDDPLSSVARGTGIVLEDLEGFRDLIIEDEHALPPTT